MAIEIDNNKMWESLRKAMWYFPEAEWLTRSIDTALSEQGLTVNDKGEITTIEPEVKWYVALNDYGHRDTITGAVPLFLNGERTTKENVFNMCKDIMDYEITEEEFNKNFRPATEEEIQQTSTKPHTPLEHQGAANDHVESKPEPNKCLFTKDHYTDEERKELCEGCQEECELNKNIPMFKEVERNGKVELTDFEKVLAECIHRAQGSVLSPEGVAITWSDALMAEAKKQIASELESMVDTMVSQNGGMCVHYREGIEDVINKIKGESV